MSPLSDRDFSFSGGECLQRLRAVFARRRIEQSMWGQRIAEAV